jgi:hypothetical protein
MSWMLLWGIFIFIIIAVLLVIFLVDKNSSSNQPTDNSSANSRVSAWNNQYGEKLQNIKNSITNTITVADSLNYANLQTSCQQLTTDISIAQNLSAIPNSIIQANLINSLKTLTQATNNCMNGSAIYLNTADNGNYNLTTEAINDMQAFNINLQQGSAQFYSVTNAL